MNTCVDVCRSPIVALVPTKARRRRIDGVRAAEVVRQSPSTRAHVVRTSHRGRAAARDVRHAIGASASRADRCTTNATHRRLSRIVVFSTVGVIPPEFAKADLARIVSRHAPLRFRGGGGGGVVLLPPTFVVESSSNRPSVPIRRSPVAAAPPGLGAAALAGPDPAVPGGAGGDG